jgi:hypothetical protein
MNYEDNGIWFEEEDPTSEFYKPECCRNVYLDLASGVFDKHILTYHEEDDEIKNEYIDYSIIMNKWKEIEKEEEEVSDEKYDDDDEFVEIDLSKY